MFVFSKQHAYQNDPAVQQILVFSSQGMKEMFEHEMLDRHDKALSNEMSVNEISDTDAGAIYKLRAVKHSAGTYAAMIRCGFTGRLLWEDYDRYDNPEHALLISAGHLRTSIANAVTHDIVSSSMKK